MPRSRPRPLVLAGVVTVALLALSACGEKAAGSDDASAATAPEDAFHAEPDLAGTTSLSIDARFEDVDGPAARVLAPGVDLRITGVATLDELDADVYAEFTGDEPGRDDSGEPIEVVHPAEGQVFYAAEFSSDDPQWEPRGELPDSVASVVIDGNDAVQVFDTGEGTMHRGTIVLSAPQGLEPKAAVLEVETDEKFQSLSLLDGQRVSSDVEQVYAIADSEVAITSAEEFEETFTGWAGDKQRIAGSVADAFTTAWLDRDHGGDGWAGSGKVYLSVEVDWAEFESTSFDESTIHLTLDNGKTVQLDNDPSSLKNAFADDAVFQIPADTEQVKVVVTPQVTVGGDTRTHDWDPVTAEVAITK